MLIDLFGGFVSYWASLVAIAVLLSVARQPIEPDKAII